MFCQWNFLLIIQLRKLEDCWWHAFWNTKSWVCLAVILWNVLLLLSSFWSQSERFEWIRGKIGKSESWEADRSLSVTSLFSFSFSHSAWATISIHYLIALVSFLAMTWIIILLLCFVFILRPLHNGLNFAIFIWDKKSLGSRCKQVASWMIVNTLMEDLYETPELWEERVPTFRNVMYLFIQAILLSV